MKRVIAMSTSEAPNPVYEVLARKYRPTTFADLIGQDALVRTLSNAIEKDRIAHAFLLTGIRGVGKTTTARIIARALNCVGADGNGKPTTNPCGVCDQCKAIKEDRHPDVLEMDAASRTGVGDIREIIDNTRYLPTTGRYKIYIIDEVHMLSNSAFNALLKTLEEPPPHVKFIFATTEIRKIPVTILSRCQRFDLPRITPEVLSPHLASVAEKEAHVIEGEALALLTQAAEGSVRDGLSLLDQAIAYSNSSGDGKTITAEIIRTMLGLADKAAIFALFTLVTEGKTKEALEKLRELYAAGGDPALIVQDMLELINLITRITILPELVKSPHLTSVEREQGKALAETLSVAYLSRAWQITLKGLQEVQQAPNGLMAAEMLLVRLAHVSDLPSPGEFIKYMKKQGSAQTVSAPAASAPVSHGATALAPQPVLQEAPQAHLEAAPHALADFAAVAELFREKQEVMLYHILCEEVHAVNFAQGKLELQLHAGVPADVTGRIGTLLTEWTGTRWVVIISKAQGAPTLYEQAQALVKAEEETVNNHPVIKPILAAFEGAKVIAFERKN
jgi:DNA polymerase-3 subunit gamma/tau